MLSSMWRMVVLIIKFPNITSRCCVSFSFLRRFQLYYYFLLCGYFLLYAYLQSLSCICISRFLEFFACRFSVSNPTKKFWKISFWCSLSHKHKHCIRSIGIWLIFRIICPSSVRVPLIPSVYLWLDFCFQFFRIPTQHVVPVCSIVSLPFFTINLSFLLSQLTFLSVVFFTSTTFLFGRCLFFHWEPHFSPYFYFGVLCLATVISEFYSSTQDGVQLQFKWKVFHCSRLGGVMVSVLATEPKGHVN
jgi:hypothetical protein